MWFCWALWLFSTVLRTADSNRSLIQVVVLSKASLSPSTKRPPFPATYFLLLQPLPALLLHSSAPLLLFQPVLQEFPLPLLQLLLIVPPGPLLPLQPVLLPKGCGQTAGEFGQSIIPAGWPAALSYRVTSAAPLVFPVLLAASRRHWFH